jgi:hypothetical protein
MGHDAMVALPRRQDTAKTIVHYGLVGLANTIDVVTGIAVNAIAFGPPFGNTWRLAVSDSASRAIGWPAGFRR